MLSCGYVPSRSWAAARLAKSSASRSARATRSAPAGVRALRSTVASAHVGGHRDGDPVGDHVVHDGACLGALDDLLELLGRRVAADRERHVDAVEPVAIGVVDPRGAAGVEHAGQRRAHLVQVDLASRGDVDDSQGQAARERVEEVLRRIRRLVVAEQHGRLGGVDDERLVARRVLCAGAPEAVNGRPTVRAVEPAVADPELEAGGLGLRLEDVERAVHLGGVDAVAKRGGGGGGGHGRKVTRPSQTVGKRAVGAMGVGRPRALPNGYRGTTGVSFAVRVMSAIDTVIIGAGQAGLALSRLLTEARHDHVVLERGRVGERWRSERWDSLALLTPNWANRLPNDDAPGDAHAYASRADFVATLERYARSFGAPVRERTTVTAVERTTSGLRVRTDRGDWHARNVVVASGDCAVPAVPWFAGSAPEPVAQLHASRYRAPASLAPGGVLVVGSGPSGHQIADELARAGRRVVLAVGRHARIVRRYRGRDIWAWLHALGDLSRAVDDLSPRARNRPRPALPLDGRRGGRTIDLGSLADAGVRIAGRLEGFAGGHALFGSGLRASIAEADERLGRLLAGIDDHIDSRCDARAFPPPEHVAPLHVPPPPRALDLAGEGISTIVWATGYRRHFPWLRIREVIRDDGGILHDRGRTAVPGLFVLGMQWQSRMISHQIGGVGADAAFLAGRIAGSAEDRRALRAAA